MLTTDEVLILSQGKPEDRQGVAESDIDMFINNRIEELQRNISEIRHALFLKGMLTTDVFYETAKACAFTKDRTRLMPRVRWDFRYGTPSFQWEIWNRSLHTVTGTTEVKVSAGAGRSYIGYVRRKGQRTCEKMKVVLTSKTVSTNKQTLRVNEKEFLGEPEWARTLAVLVEDKLVCLRRFSKVLSDVSRLVQFLKRGRNTDVQ